MMYMLLDIYAGRVDETDHAVPMRSWEGSAHTTVELRRVQTP